MPNTSYYSSQLTALLPSSREVSLAIQSTWCSKNVYMSELRENCLYKTTFYFLIIKPTRYTNFSNLFLQYYTTCFGHFLCPSSGVFHCKHSNGICHTACEQDQDGHVSDISSVHHQVFFHCTHRSGLCHTGLLTACEQDQFRPDPALKLSANLYDI